MIPTSFFAGFNSFLISDAMAQSTEIAPAGSGFGSLIPLILVFVVMYLLIFRPQQKKAKKHQEMVNNLKIGNRVCTNSGIFGVVREIDPSNGVVDLEIAKGVVIKVLKFSISEVIVKEVVKNQNSNKKMTKKIPAKKVKKNQK